MSTDPTATSFAQLAMIAAVSAQLESWGVNYWLSGGWAVDFHAGRVTREHSDVDFVVALEARHQVGRFLVSNGYRPVPLAQESGIDAYELDGVRLELTFVSVSPEGPHVTPGYESWPWPEGTFRDDVVELEGVQTQVMSVFGLLDMKRGWEANLGEPLRSHDRADLLLLAEMMKGEAK